MTSEYSIEQARARLGDLVTAAQQGQTIIITRHGKPAAMLTSHEEPTMKLIDFARAHELHTQRYWEWTIEQEEGATDTYACGTRGEGLYRRGSDGVWSQGAGDLSFRMPTDSKEAAIRYLRDWYRRKRSAHLVVSIED